MVTISRKEVRKMSKAIGMAEYKTVSAGVLAADAMVKAADVTIIEAQDRKSVV